MTSRQKLASISASALACSGALTVAMAQRLLFAMAVFVMGSGAALRGRRPATHFTFQHLGNRRQQEFAGPTPMKELVRRAHTGEEVAGFSPPRTIAANAPRMTAAVPQLNPGVMKRGRRCASPLWISTVSCD